MCISYTKSLKYMLKSAFILIFKRSHPTIFLVFLGCVSLTGGFLFARAKGLLCPQYGSLYMWSIKEGAYEAELTNQPSVLKQENRKVGFCLLIDTFLEQNVFY